jgi:hypothetical protein
VQVRLSIVSHTAQTARSLRTVELGFQLSHLLGRRRTESLTAEERQQLKTLRPLFEGDGGRGRRRHRRFGVHLPVYLWTQGCQGHGILINFSSGGLFVATTHEVDQGAQVHVELGQPDEVIYLFKCHVARKLRRDGGCGLGCRLSEAPVELRQVCAARPN